MSQITNPFTRPAFDYFTYTFSTILTRNKNRAELDDAIEIDQSFLDSIRIQQSNLFPNKRATWELQCSHRRSRISKEIQRTFFDLGKPQTFDEMLYGLYARKVQLLTDEEAQKIYYIKLAHLKNTRLFASPKGKEAKERISKAESFRINEDCFEENESSNGEQYPLYYEIGKANVTIYLLLKKSSLFGPEKFKPIVTLCLLVAPTPENTNMTERFVQQIAPIREWKFELGPAPAHGNTVRAVSLTDLGRKELRQSFIEACNKFTSSKDKKIRLTNNDSDPIISHVIFVNDLSAYSFDPLRAYVGGSQAGGSLFDFNMFLMRLLIDSFFSIDPNLVKAQKVFAGRACKVSSPVGVDTPIYLAPYRTVSIVDNSKEDIISTLNQPSATRDYSRVYPFIVASWNYLLDSLVTSQSLIFTHYSQALTTSTNPTKGPPVRVLKKMTEQALNDFEEYYDMDIVTSEGKMNFMEQYELSKRLNNVNYYFKTLKEKILMYGQFQIAEEQRKENWVLLALTVIVGLVPAVIEVLRTLGYLR